MAENVPGCLDARDPLPFEDLFLPLVSQAREQLRQSVGLIPHRSLTPDAHFQWERYLLTRLVNAGAEAAQWQFEVFKTVRMAFPGNRFRKQAPPNALYREFIGAKAYDRLRLVFDEFPVLEEICTVLRKNWVAAGAEFLHRLQADHVEFTGHFFEGAFALPAIKIDTGLGDPHRGGRCVIRIGFKDGASLIYKPRSLTPEAHFSALLDACNHLDIPHRLRAPLCWDRGEYGWMENIEPSPCHAQPEIHAFYWRAGALLGLVHLAKGVDFHQGNLIAAGEYPVLIDLESLWHLPMPDDDAPIVSVDSVLRTGLLPRGERRADALYQWSGLSWTEHARRPAVVWLRLNQNQMSMETQIRDSSNQSHLPTLGEKIHLAPAYTADVVTGFCWVGENLLASEHGRKMLSRWLNILAACPRRLIIRPTLVYVAALRKITASASLRDALPIAARAKKYRPQIGPNFEDDELHALAQMDIPYFAQSAAGTSLTHANDSIFNKESYLAQISVVQQSLRGFTAGAPQRVAA